MQLTIARLSNGFYFELDAFVLLNAADNLKEVARVGVARRPEHAHQTLGRLVREGAKLLEPDGSVYVVTQYDLASINISGKAGIRRLLSTTLLEMPGRAGPGPERSP